METNLGAYADAVHEAETFLERNEAIEEFLDALRRSPKPLKKAVAGAFPSGLLRNWQSGERHSLEDVPLSLLLLIAQVADQGNFRHFYPDAGDSDSRAFREQLGEDLSPDDIEAAVRNLTGALPARNGQAAPLAPQVRRRDKAQRIAYAREFLRSYFVAANSGTLKEEYPGLAEKRMSFALIAEQLGYHKSTIKRYYDQDGEVRQWLDHCRGLWKPNTPGRQRRKPKHYSQE